MNETIEPAVHEPEVAVFLGMSNRVLAGRDRTDGSVSVVEVTVPPGVGAPLHTNTREALTWYVLDGTLAFVHGDGMVDVGAGRLVFLPPGQVHTFTNRTDLPARALLICTPGGLEGFFTELAAALPADAPTGPPPPEALAVMQEIGRRYGLELPTGAAS